MCKLLQVGVNLQEIASDFEGRVPVYQEFTYFPSSSPMDLYIFHMGLIGKTAFFMGTPVHGN